jgi:hypothetical protein
VCYYNQNFVVAPDESKGSREGGRIDAQKRI